MVNQNISEKLCQIINLKNNSKAYKKTQFDLLISKRINDNWTKKMLNIKHFWGHFSIKHWPPKKMV